MKIRFVRSGGFGGLKTSGVVDTSTLPLSEAKKVQDLVEAAGFFSLPKKFPKPQKGADYYTYSLTVEYENQSHSVEVSEPAVPATLRPLIRYLMNHKKG